MSSVRQVARRYAEALADAAEAANGLNEVARDLRAFGSLVAGNEELRRVFESPAVQPDDRTAVLNAVIKLAEPVPLVTSFLQVLNRNYRLHCLGAVVDEFAKVVDARLGVVVAEVTTAHEMSKSEQDAVVASLARATGKSIKPSFATDDTIIGGVVARIGSRIYDGSIRSKLEALQRQLSGQV